MKNIHKDQTCIIIGNGPSLSDIPLTLLAKYPSFGCNQIRMLEDFKPTYFSALGYNMLDTKERREAMRKTVKDADMAFINVLYIEHYGYKHVWPIMGDNRKPAQRALEEKLDRRYEIKIRSLFQKEMQIGNLLGRPYLLVGVGFTQTYVNLQIAYWMGFKTALMVGIDHEFGSPDRHFYKDSEIESFHLSEQRTGEEKESAFRLSLGADWAYRQARAAYEEDGRQILNLTPGSKAKALEFGRIEDWM